MNLQNVRNPVINGGKFGNLILTSIFGISDKRHPNARKSVPELLNRKNQPNLATAGQMRPFFADEGISRGLTLLSFDGMEKYVKNSDLLRAFSPAISKTVGALESKLPLADLPLENGKVVFMGEFYGETVLIAGSKDKLLEAAKIAITEAGINAGLNEQQINQQIKEKLSTPGVFVAMESNYDIVDASPDGKSYTILADDMPSQQLAQALKFYFGNFEDGQKRKIDSALGIPTGKLISDSLGLSVGRFYYSKPGPAVLYVSNFGNSDRFYANFGDVGRTLNGRFGGAQWQPSSATVLETKNKPDLKAVVLEKGQELLLTSLTPEQIASVNEMMAAAKVN